MLFGAATVAALALATGASAQSYVRGEVGAAMAPEVSVAVGTATPYATTTEVEIDQLFNRTTKNGRVSGTLVGVNVNYNLPVKYIVQPYVTAGVGEAFLTGSGVQHGDRPFVTAGIGATYVVAKDWTVGARYRFVATGVDAYTTGHKTDKFAVNEIGVTVSHPF